MGRNKPKDEQNGKGDGSYIFINHKKDKINKERNRSIEGPHKKNKTLTLFHELFHSYRMNKGVIKDNKTEEIKATQFINRNFRNEKNRRKKIL
ncbi:M91 family zinc metallopeptidase [Lacinutrix undariae]